MSYRFIAAFWVSAALMGCMATQRPIPPAAQIAAPDPRPDNQGKYLSPYTTDDVLAKWVDKGVNAKLGSTVGSVAASEGARFAAEQALGAVPFVGLFAGAAGDAIGDAAGREIAIEMSGGWEFIRSTSDMSFDSPNQMAVWMYATQSHRENYPKVLEMVSEIYPELKADYQTYLLNAPLRQNYAPGQPLVAQAQPPAQQPAPAPAPAPAQAEPPPAPAKPKEPGLAPGFEAHVYSTLGMAGGSYAADGENMGDYLDTMYSVALDGGYRWSPDSGGNNYFGVSLQQATFSGDFCSNSIVTADFSLTQTDCLATDTQFGLVVGGFDGDEKKSSYFHGLVGFGWEWYNQTSSYDYTDVDGQSSGTFDDTLHGPYLSLNLGYDFKIGQHFAMGPYANFTAGTFVSYSSYVDDVEADSGSIDAGDGFEGWHFYPAFGVRAAFR